MKNRHIRSLGSIICIYFICIPAIQGQQLILTAGMDASGTGGSVSFSLAQTFFTGSSGINGTVAEGVQQPYEISVVIAVTPVPGPEMKCQVYPNPAGNYINVSVDEMMVMQSSYALYDLQGKNLGGELIMERHQRITLSHLTPGIYLLKISDTNQIVKSFRIIKH
jgi:hypothetical protein